MNFGDFLISLFVILAVVTMFETYIDYNKKGK
jgi:hypothetical protein